MSVLACSSSAPTTRQPQPLLCSGDPPFGAPPLPLLALALLPALAPVPAPPLLPGLLSPPIPPARAPRAQIPRFPPLLPALPPPPPLPHEPPVLGGFEHWPVVGSHVPTSWHSSMAVQTTGLAPRQA